MWKGKFLRVSALDKEAQTTTDFWKKKNLSEEDVTWLVVQSRLVSLEIICTQKTKKKDIRGSTYIYMNAYHTYVFNIYHHKASISLRQTWKGSREDNWKELRMGESGEKWCNYISIQTLKVKKRKVASVNKDLHEFIREYLVFLLNFIFFSCCYLRANLIYLRLATN